MAETRGPCKNTHAYKYTGRLFQTRGLASKDMQITMFKVLKEMAATVAKHEEKLLFLKDLTSTTSTTKSREKRKISFKLDQYPIKIFKQHKSKTFKTCIWQFHIRQNKLNLKLRPKALSCSLTEML